MVPGARHQSLRCQTLALYRVRWKREATVYLYPFEEHGKKFGIEDNPRLAGGSGRGRGQAQALSRLRWMR